MSAAVHTQNFTHLWTNFTSSVLSTMACFYKQQKQFYHFTNNKNSFIIHHKCAFWVTRIPHNKKDNETIRHNKGKSIQIKYTLLWVLKVCCHCMGVTVMTNEWTIHSPLDKWGVSLYGCGCDDEWMHQCHETLLMILPDENLKTSGRRRTATIWATVNDQPALCFYSVRIRKVSGDQERRHSSRSQQLASLVLLLNENLKTSGNEERQRPSENERPASFVLSLGKNPKTSGDEERCCSGNSERPASFVLSLGKNPKTSGDDERCCSGNSEQPASFVLSLGKNPKTSGDKERCCSGNSERPASFVLSLGKNPKTSGERRKVLFRQQWTTS